VCGRAAARIEKKGIPTFVVAREGFSTVVNNAFLGIGLPAESAHYAFPSEIFLPGGDLTSIEQNIDRIIDGLTNFKFKTREKGISKPKKIIVEGKDYEEAFINMNNLFLRNMWSDGLPIIPPTQERVDWILKGTELSPETLVGKGRIFPKGGLATVEMISVCLAMAGGRPEYLLIAGVEAMTDPEVAHQAWSSTTGPSIPIVIVNGPITKQIRLNSGYGCLGPSSEFPAGASIGRAIRLILMDLGGATPGRGTMSLWGAPGRYTNLVFGEDEDSLPSDWEPLNVEQGYSRNSNTAYVHVVDLTGQIWEGRALTEEEAIRTLNDCAKMMSGTAHPPTWMQFRHTAGTPGYLLLGGSTVQALSKLGWSKNKVKSFLWENTSIQESADLRSLMEHTINHEGAPKEYIRWPLPIARAPDNIKIVVCGGRQSGHSFWLRVDQRGVANSAAIKLPANWNELLRKAEEDLGPIPMQY
jgi:hypothetical protein